MTDESKILYIDHIEVKPGSDKPRIKGHGITVAFLSTFMDDPEWTVQRICEGYNLTPAQVYAAWSYYSDHKDEIDRAIEEGERRVEESARPTNIWIE